MNLSRRSLIAGLLAAVVAFMPHAADAQNARRLLLNGVKPYLGQVATRSMIFTNFSGGANTQAMARSRHIMRAQVGQIAIVWPTWWMNTGTEAETALGGTESITAAIEYPPGTCTRITWGGQTTGTLQDNSNTRSDFVAAPPKGAVFFIRVWLSNTGLGLISQSRNVNGGMSYQGARDGVNGEALHFAFGGTVPDQTLSCDAITNNDLGSAMIAPVAIVGNTSTPSFYCWGDSRVQGVQDYYNDGSTNIGSCARVIGPNFPYIGGGAFGQSALNWNGSKSYPRQIELAHYTSHLYSELGINDINASQSPTALIANLKTGWGLLGATRIFQTTLPPITTSTDGWATTNNQTKMGQDANRVSFDTSVRAILPGTLGSVDLASQAESGLNSGLWWIPPGTCTLTASAASSVLTVTATTCTDLGPGVYITTATAAFGQITSNGTGTGTTGTYNVSSNSSVASSPMTAHVATAEGIHEEVVTNQLYNTSGIFNPAAVHYP